MYDARTLVAGIEQMLAAEEPLSFYDAVRVVRRARQIAMLDDDCLRMIVAMHDSTQATDGAREVLRELLAARAAVMAAERELASRPLTLADSGKTARLPPGGCLVLHLRENAPVGFRWQVARASTSLRIQRCGRVRTASPTVEYRVTATRAGTWALSMVESRPASVEAGEGSVQKPAAFALSVVVEPS